MCFIILFTLVTVAITTLLTLAVLEYLLSSLSLSLHFRIHSPLLVLYPSYSFFLLSHLPHFFSFTPTFSPSSILVPFSHTLSRPVSHRSVPSFTPSSPPPSHTFIPSPYLTHSIPHSHPLSCLHHLTQSFTPSPPHPLPCLSRPQPHPLFYITIPLAHLALISCGGVRCVSGVSGVSAIGG